MMKYEVSVIIPVYNGEKYIERCILSILAQTIISKTEIIIVNDGSTDRTEQILNQYKKYANLQVICQNNLGVWEARKTGLEHASGKWVSFVDSDDYCERNMLESLIRATNFPNVKMVCASNENKVLNHNQALNAVIEHSDIGYTLHGILFETERLKQCYTLTPNISRGEDTVINAKYIAFDSQINVAFVEGNFYIYCDENPESLSKIMSAKTNYDMGIYLCEMADICRSNHVVEWASKYYIDYLNFMIIASKYATMEKNDKIKLKCHRRFKKDYKRNEKYPYKLKALLFMLGILENPFYLKLKKTQ